MAAPAWAATAADGPSRLVVVMLRGAVDGLNLVVPYGEEAYYAARPTIAIAKPGAGDGAALALDEHFALHPALAGLMPLWQAGQLAFIHAAGSPDPTRSHFDAQLFIENGTPGRRVTADGWMNRLLAALPGAPNGPTSAVAVGPTLPQILRGRLPVANLPLGPAAANKMAIDRPEVAQAFDRLYSANDPLGRAYRQGRAARAELIGDLSSEQQMADNGAPPANTYPTQAAKAGRAYHPRPQYPPRLCRPRRLGHPCPAGRPYRPAGRSAAPARRWPRRLRARARQRLGGYRRHRDLGIRPHRA